MDQKVRILILARDEEGRDFVHTTPKMEITKHQQQYDTANDIANGVYDSMDIMRERATADKVKIFVYISNRVAIEKANRRGEGKFNLLHPT